MHFASNNVRINLSDQKKLKLEEEVKTINWDIIDIRYNKEEKPKLLLY